MRPSFHLLILALLFTVSLQGTNFVYNKLASASNMRSAYLVPSCVAGDIIQVQVIQNGGNNAFILQLWRPSTAYPKDSPEQTASLSGSASFNSTPVSKSGAYAVQILPSSPSSPTFAFNIRIKVNNITVGTYTDVARYDRIFALYQATMGTYQVSVVAPAAVSSSYVITVYGPFTELQVSGGSSVGNLIQSSSSVTYSSNGNEYFYVSIRLNDDYYKSNKNINIQYTTDLFACPNDQAYTDINLVYQGCSNNLPTIGYPCRTYNPNIQKCTDCYSPWVANSFGVCVQNTNCPANQYYSYGQCFDVIPKCANFQFFGGLCYNCTEGYNLTVQANGAQACLKVQITCASNQYLMGDTCFNTVPNCGDFKSSTGTCLSCLAGYILNGNACEQQVSNPLNCPLGQTNINGICTAIDQFCIFYNPDNTCMLCAKGYQIVAGRCSKIICGDRQYSGSGSCVDVSPLCDTFDPIYGNCFTCVYLYYLQADGSCLQVLTSQLGSSKGSSSNSNSECANGYYLRQGTCVQVSPTCGTYDSNTGQCTTCCNSSYYLNQTNGACVLISTICGYRTYFSNGNCLPVSNLCDEFDITNGNCLSCRDGSAFSNGNCVFSVACGDRMYHAADGNCAKVSDKCDDYDRNSGVCLSCISGYELNTGGICCYAYNYMIDPTCTQFYAPNCLTQRQQFKYCTKCAQGYALTNGVFGRCNMVPTNQTVSN